MLLTKEDLVRVTGLVRGSAQAEFLRERYGLIVPPNNRGEVALTWEALTRAQLGEMAGKAGKREPVLRM